MENMNLRRTTRGAAVGRWMSMLSVYLSHSIEEAPHCSQTIPVARNPIGAGLRPVCRGMWARRQTSGARRLRHVRPRPSPPHTRSASKIRRAHRSIIFVGREPVRSGGSQLSPPRHRVRGGSFGRAGRWGGKQSVKRDPDRDMMFHPNGPVVHGKDPADLCEATLGAYLATIGRARSGAPS